LRDYWTETTKFSYNWLPSPIRVKTLVRETFYLLRAGRGEEIMLLWSGKGLLAVLFAIVGVFVG
jgi:hypothetical protein